MICSNAGNLVVFFIEYSASLKFTHLRLTILEFRLRMFLSSAGNTVVFFLKLLWEFIEDSTSFKFMHLRLLKFRLRMTLFNDGNIMVFFLVLHSNFRI